mmetsp:Transcript_14097/g.19559  ORF Transcript_14097/g.19559 Transcript_14097/m.19559 type:complete len:350 (-) Transcript_14097:151-1200(-)
MNNCAQNQSATVDGLNSFSNKRGSLQPCSLPSAASLDVPVLSDKGPCSSALSSVCSKSSQKSSGDHQKWKDERHADSDAVTTQTRGSSINNSFPTQIRCKCTSNVTVGSSIRGANKRRPCHQCCSKPENYKSLTDFSPKSDDDLKEVDSLRTLYPLRTAAAGEEDGHAATSCIDNHSRQRHYADHKHHAFLAIHYCANEHSSPTGSSLESNNSIKVQGSGVENDKKTIEFDDNSPKYGCGDGRHRVGSFLMPVLHEDNSMQPTSPPAAADDGDETRDDSRLRFALMHTGRSHNHSIRRAATARGIAEGTPNRRIIGLTRSLRNAVVDCGVPSSTDADDDGIIDDGGHNF